MSNAQKFVYIKSDVLPMNKTHISAEELKTVFETYQSLSDRVRDSSEGSSIVPITPVSTPLYEALLNQIILKYGSLAMCTHRIEIDEPPSVFLIIAREDFNEFVASYEKSLSKASLSMSDKLNDFLKERLNAKALLAKFAV